MTDCAPIRPVAETLPIALYLTFFLYALVVYGGIVKLLGKYGVWQFFSNDHKAHQNGHRVHIDGRAQGQRQGGDLVGHAHLVRAALADGQGGGAGAGAEAATCWVTWPAPWR